MAANDETTDRVYVNVPMSAEFKSAFERWCDSNGYKVMARAGQKAIASLIGYDLSNEPEPKSKSKYGKNEAGEVDRQYAKYANSYKGAQQTSLLRAGLKAKVAKKADEIARIDLELDALLSDDWQPSLAKQLELRMKAVETLIKEKKIPSDYEDERLEEIKSELLTQSAE